MSGAIIGMILLLAALMVRGGASDEFCRSGQAMLGYLSLFFVPSGVGIMQYLPLLRAHWLPLLLALIVNGPCHGQRGTGHAISRAAAAAPRHPNYPQCIGRRRHAMTSVSTTARMLAQNPVFSVTATMLAFEIGRWGQFRCGDWQPPCVVADVSPRILLRAGRATPGPGRVGAAHWNRGIQGHRVKRRHDAIDMIASVIICGFGSFRRYEG